MRPEWRIVNVGNPPVGGGFSHVVPGAVIQRVCVISFTLHNAAHAADRRPVVTFVDGSGVSFGSFAPSVVTQTGVTSAYTFATGIQEYGVTNSPHIGAPLADVLLEVGSSVVVSVDGIFTSDAIVDARLYVEQIGVRPENENGSSIEGSSTGDWTRAPVAR